MSWAYTPAYTATRLRVLSAAGLCIVGVGFATLRWNTPAVRAQERLGVNTPIEDPTRTLAPRFRALFQEASTRLVRLSFWGTSHTASDQYTSVLREALQQRFGDGGSGTFLPARPMTFYDRRDIAFEASAGFVGVSTRRTTGTLVLGATGMVLDARRTATARVRVRHPSTGVARLWAVGIGPGRGRVALTIGGRHAERELEVGERAMVELSVAGCASGAGASGGCDVDSHSSTYRRHTRAFSPSQSTRAAVSSWRASVYPARARRMRCAGTMASFASSSWRARRTRCS